MAVGYITHERRYGNGTTVSLTPSFSSPTMALFFIKSFNGSVSLSNVAWSGGGVLTYIGGTTGGVRRVWCYAVKNPTAGAISGILSSSVYWEIGCVQLSDCKYVFPVYSYDSGSKTSYSGAAYCGPNDLAVDAFIGSYARTFTKGSGQTEYLNIGTYETMKTGGSYKAAATSMSYSQDSAADAAYIVITAKQEMPNKAVTGVFLSEYGVM